MPKLFKNKELPEKTRGQKLVDCVFEGCTTSLGRFSSVVDTSIENATVGTFCGAEQVVLRNVTIDGLRTKQPLHAKSCLFDRVVLRGEIGVLRIDWRPEYFDRETRRQTAKFYDDVEWALDLRDVRAAGLIVRGVPHEKVRRDPTRHFVVDKTKLRATTSVWRALPLPVQRRVEFWLMLPGDYELVIANDRSPHFAAQRACGEALRQAGFAT